MRKTSTLELDSHPSFSKLCADPVIPALLEISSGKPAMCPYWLAHIATGTWGARPQDGIGFEVNQTKF